MRTVFSFTSLLKENLLLFLVVVFLTVFLINTFVITPVKKFSVIKKEVTEETARVYRERQRLNQLKHSLIQHKFIPRGFLYKQTDVELAFKKRVRDFLGGRVNFSHVSMVSRNVGKVKTTVRFSCGNLPICVLRLLEIQREFPFLIKKWEIKERAFTCSGELFFTKKGV